MDVSGKKVVVVGLGRSGAAAARLARRAGAEVTVTEQREDRQLQSQAGRLRREGVVVQLGGHDAGVAAGAALVR